LKHANDNERLMPKMNETGISKKGACW